MWPLPFCFIATVLSKAHVYVEDNNNLHLVNILYDDGWKKDFVINPQAAKTEETAFRFSGGIGNNKQWHYHSYDDNSKELKFSRKTSFWGRTKTLMIKIKKFQEAVNEGSMAYGGKTIWRELEHYMITGHGGLRKDQKDQDEAPKYDFRSKTHFMTKHDQKVLFCLVYLHFNMRIISRYNIHTIDQGEGYSALFDDGNMATLQEIVKDKGVTISTAAIDFGQMYDHFFKFAKETKPVTGVWRYAFNEQRRKWEVEMIGELLPKKYLSLYDFLKFIQNEKKLGIGHVYVVCVFTLPDLCLFISGSANNYIEHMSIMWAEPTAISGQI